MYAAVPTMSPAWRTIGERVEIPFDGLQMLDDLSAQGLRKQIFGEVDLFQFDDTHELYAHLNINYVRLDDLGEALEPLTPGEFSRPPARCGG